VVQYYAPYKLWQWNGPESSVEKRRSRFLRLIDVLENIRVSRSDFTYFVGDPMYVKYFTSWTDKDRRWLTRQWKHLEEQKNLLGKLYFAAKARFGT
jgi:hypothetical protein